MLKSELLKLVEELGDNDNIDSVVESSELGEVIKNNNITLESFKQKLKSDEDFKSFLDSEKDKHHNKALATWKEKSLEKELEPFIAKKYPELVTDPNAKRILELETKLAEQEKITARKELLTEAMKYATEKKIPTNLVERFLEEDFDKTKTSLDSFLDTYNKSVEDVVKSKIRNSSYVPPKDGDGEVSIGESFAKANKSDAPPVDFWSNK